MPVVQVAAVVFGYDLSPTIGPSNERDVGSRNLEPDSLFGCLTDYETIFSRANELEGERMATPEVSNSFLGAVRGSVRASLEYTNRTFSEFVFDGDQSVTELRCRDPKIRSV